MTHAPLKFTVSKETTLLTEPLRPDGRVDYLQAMNDRLGRGVTPENNAAVEFVQAVGPSFLPEASRKEVLARLGLPELPETGDYLTDDYEFHEANYPQQDLMGMVVDEGSCEAFREQTEFTETHPWSKEEYPPLAAWLDANERNFRLLMAGSRKDRFYVPLVDEKGDFWRTFATDSLSKSRDVLRLFRSRALNELDSGRLEEAWRIILAGYRWAWLRSHGPLPVEYMIAVSMDNIAADVLFRLISSENLTARQTARFIADLDRLPPWPSVKESFLYGERFFFLDLFQDLATNGYELPPETITLPDGEQRVNPFALRAKATQLLVDDPRVDWNEVFRLVHEREKPYLDAWDSPDPLRQLEQIDRAQKDSPKRPDYIEIITNGDFLETATPAELAQCVVDLNHTGGLQLTLAQWECERGVRFDLCRIALALAGYRHDHGRYPTALAELCPGYLPRIPNDSFSGEGLIYEPDEDSYLLYSVGPNHRDDGGRNFRYQLEMPEPGPTDEEMSYDDIAVRMPMNEGYYP